MNIVAKMAPIFLVTLFIATIFTSQSLNGAQQLIGRQRAPVENPALGTLPQVESRGMLRSIAQFLSSYQDLEELRRASRAVRTLVPPAEEAITEIGPSWRPSDTKGILAGILAEGGGVGRPSLSKYPKNLDLFIRKLSHFPHLTKLDLSRLGKLDDFQIKNLIVAISGMRDLHSLDLRGIGLGRNIRALAVIIPRLAKLRYLNLGLNAIGPNIRALRAFPAGLQHLDIGLNGIDFASMVELVTHLPESLRYLNFELNDPDAEGAIAAILRARFPDLEIDYEVGF